MGCNKNLTNDQLEAMFTGTDEEMRQIEQLMECLIERTKHKCKRCTRFSSNEAALKQHQCELQIRKEKFPHCSKTINRANNLGLSFFFIRFSLFVTFFHFFHFLWLFFPLFVTFFSLFSLVCYFFSLFVTFFNLLSLFFYFLLLFSLLLLFFHFLSLFFTSLLLFFCTFC